jgi:hypothetical protein
MESRNDQKTLAPREERKSRFEITRVEERIAPSANLGGLINVGVNVDHTLNHSVDNILNHSVDNNLNHSLNNVLNHDRVFVNVL